VYGIKAITAANGWAMAVAGACIVVSGLAVLSFVISQLHKLVALFEKKAKTQAPPAKVESAPPPPEIPEIKEPLLNLHAAATIYRSATSDLGKRFRLEALYRFFYQHNLPHPHLTIRALREDGFLAPVGDDLFSWKEPV